MPIVQLADEYGIYMPEDLVFLKGVFDKVQQSQDLVGEGELNSAARKILYVFQTGVRDHDLLVAAVSGNVKRPRRRR